MSKIRSVAVVAGPGPVAYALNVDGALTVYVGDGYAVAPITAQHTAIAEGNSTWVMRDTADNSPPADTRQAIDARRNALLDARRAWMTRNDVEFVKWLRAELEDVDSQIQDIDNSV